MEIIEEILTTIKVSPIGQSDSDCSYDEADKPEDDYGYGIKSLVAGHGCMTRSLQYTLASGLADCCSMQLSFNKHL